MKARALLAAAMFVAGCGTGGGSAALEVQMLSVSGELSGQTFEGATGATITGERSGDQGTFFVEGPALSMQLSACPLGNLDTDPYGTGGGGAIGEGPRPPEPVDAGIGIVPQSGTVSGVDCFGRGLSICQGGSCGSFAPEEVDLSIVEQNGWRQLTADANGAGGSVQVQLLYREHR